MKATKQPSLEESLAEWQRRIASYASSLQVLRRILQAHREKAKGRQREYLDRLLETVEEMTYSFFLGVPLPTKKEKSHEEENGEESRG